MSDGPKTLSIQEYNALVVKINDGYVPSGDELAVFNSMTASLGPSSPLSPIDYQALINKIKGGYSPNKDDVASLSSTSARNMIVENVEVSGVHDSPADINGLILVAMTKKAVSNPSVLVEGLMVALGGPDGKVLDFCVVKNIKGVKSIGFMGGYYNISSQKSPDGYIKYDPTPTLEKHPIPVSTTKDNKPL